ncbi:hypothetical protein M5K25_002555 [Dendrobium thyrsiflorum]|uniref:RNase H type-1 domain-containing protein n=1 Tax=Dendrobium thyrsiflorum TaxID=117978 RepID=A0ABD0VUD2_DENTH
MMASPSSNPWLAATGDGKSRSFKDVLAGNSSVNGGKIDFVHGSFKGFPALMIDDNDISRLAAPFVFTLVGKFVGRRPNLDTIRKFFLNLKLTGTFSVGLMDPRHVAIQLANDLDYSRIFARRTYYILGCQMRLLKWTPDFDGSKPELVFNVGEQSVELADVTGDPVGDVQKPEISFNEPIDVMLDEHNNRPNSSQLIQPDQVSLLNNALDTNVSISLVQDGVQNLEEGELDQGELVVDLVNETSNLGNETVKVTNVSVANLALNDNNISVDNNANSKGDDENDFQQLKNFLNCYDAVLYFGIRHNGNFSNDNQRLVYWHKPPVSIFKLNVDGSVRNDGIGCGGIIRDDKGNLVVAFAEPLATCSVVKAELFAILKGIKLCFSRDIYNIWIEVDAISTIHFLMQNSSNVVKHDLFYLIREIKHLLNMANCNMSHVYREGNACADWLANFGCNLSCFTEFSTNNLPLPVKGMIRLDKLNMPYLRK